MNPRKVLTGHARQAVKLLPGGLRRRMQHALLRPEEIILLPEHFAAAIGLPDTDSAGLQYDCGDPVNVGPPKDTPSALECIAIIRSTDITKLGSVEFLENELLPKLGFNNENFDEFPPHLQQNAGYGLKIWQYPNQFARYLAGLTGKGINSYIELGVRHGGTFILTVEYLARFGRLDTAVAVDIVPSQTLGDYAKQSPNVRYLIASSRSDQVRAIVKSRKWDLVLIDGDHSFHGCLHDFLTVRDYARYIALHDIVSAACPGVRGVWQLISNFIPQDAISVYTAQYQEVFRRTGCNYLGIGMIDFSQISRQ
jgi:cephalosporin hydroxylase